MQHALGATLPLWSVLPFAGLLLTIALGPLLAPIWWAEHYGKVSIGLGTPVALYFLGAAPGHLFNTAHEYVAFIILLGTLFVITGGIVVRGAFPPTPAVNSAFLGLGAVLANVIGTTGASMLLVRPLLRANARRPAAAHVFIFFIFLVSNLGGALTPLGDPPLFLGFLEGVPFFWTLRLWPQWVFTVAMVLGVFYVLDRNRWQRETQHPLPEQAFAIVGTHNFLFLGGVVVAVFLPTPLREVVMASMGALSYVFTRDEIHTENQFTFHPIQEVALLFAGIFMTMMPALLILEARGSHLGLHQPWHFFWVTGALSSFLDNAPTYLTFLAAVRGLGLPAQIAGVPQTFLAAVSLGAVFMGANSYIGNGPNFMVKAIAEQHGVRMPTFLGYMVYSGLVLLPVFLLVTLVFFR
ncbi:MAG TPA: sodium:proton antiporter [Candidatus Margulisiibacteriota bacterium]|nr:sodium:proton antiporter [Candidatus Margulisiibacteriota bacterium]